MVVSNLSLSAKKSASPPVNISCSGIYNGNLSAIQGFIKRGLAEYKNPLQLILTGGDADKNELNGYLVSLEDY
jgi:hypothetical protein